MKQLNYSAFTPMPKSKEAQAIPAPGLRGKLDRAVYDMLGALSCTSIKKWIELESVPFEYGWWLMDRWVDATSSAALSMGSALDSILLEGEHVFSTKFVVLTKDGPKRVTDGHRERHPGQIVLAYEQWQTVLSMARALRESHATGYGVDFTVLQKQCAVARVFDVPFKCEFDLFEERSEEICDIKSAKDVTSKGFKKAFAEYGYDYQASIYLAIANALGYKKRTFNFICVKNSEPFTVKAYRFRPFSNTDHRAIYQGCLAKVKASIDTLLEAMAGGFQTDNRWEDVEVDSWKVRQAESLLIEA